MWMGVVDIRQRQVVLSIRRYWADIALAFDQLLLQLRFVNHSDQAIGEATLTPVIPGPGSLSSRARENWFQAS
jgi:hypothetical protein